MVRLNEEQLAQLFCHHVLLALQEKNLITESITAQILARVYRERVENCVRVNNYRGSASCSV
jgi:hypothetical protein